MKMTNPLLTTENNQLKIKTKSNKKSAPSGIYSKELIFPVEKDIDKLAQTFIELTPSMTPSAVDIIADFLAFKIPSDIFLETSQKVCLMHIKPEYHIYKFEQTSHTGVFNQIQRCSQPPDNFLRVIGPAPTTSGTCTISIPIFFFFSVLGGIPLDVRNIENLQIRIIINTREAMGIQTAGGVLQTLTGLDVRIINESYNSNLSQKNHFQYGPSKLPIYQSLKNTYNVFYEDTVDLATGSSSATILLRCPYPCVNLLGTINYQNNRIQINKYSIKVRNSYIVGGDSIDTAIDTNTGFDLANLNDTAFNQIEYLEHFFNKKNNIFSDTGMVSFSDQDAFYPTYLTVYYDTLIAPSKLHIFEEYITSFSVDNFRKVIVNDTSSTLLKPNSVLSQ